MADWHGYVLIEATVNLNQENFDRLADAFRAVSPVNPNIPAHVMHTRRRLDGLAEIFEAKFDPAAVEVESFKRFMADLFEKLPTDVEDAIRETMSHSQRPGIESRQWSFFYPAGGAERLRVTRFGRGGSHEDSRQEARAYIIAHSGEWEGDLP